MVNNFFRAAFRMLLKNRWHALINIVGLTLGMGCAVVIFSIIRFELNFNGGHPAGDRIYRIVTERMRFGETSFTAGITYPLPEALRQDFPDLEYVSIADQNTSFPVITVDAGGTPKLFKEKDFAYVDPEFVKMFHYDWLEGSPENALAGERTVILTESVARRYFNGAPALGQVLMVDSKYQITVTGVVKDPPLNTDLKYKILFSNRLGSDKHAWDTWGSTSSGINCYVQLKPNVSTADFQAKLKGWHTKYFVGDDQQDGENMTYFLQPLNEVHFDTRFSVHGGNVVSINALLALSLVGILLLITACINFVNLNSVLISHRSKEVGVRKVLGVNKPTLVMSFLGETFIVAALALVVSYGLIEFSLIFLHPLLGYALTIDFFTDPVMVIFTGSLLILVTLMAGLAPGLSLAGFQPIRALKARTYEGASSGINLRRSLIGFQLIISQALIICTVIILQQLDYFSSQPLGLDSSSVVEFELPLRKSIDFGILKQRMKAIDGVANVSMSSTGSANVDSWGGDFEAIVNGERVKQGAVVKFADEDYLKTYKLKLVAGRDLVHSDTTAMFVINESAVKALGLNDPADAIGIPMTIWGRKALVSGVVQDFHTSSLHEAINPVVIMSERKNYFLTAVRLSTSDVLHVIPELEKVWKETYPNFVFEYSFLDDAIAQFYKSEQRTSQLISIASVIAILIGTIGLLGLVSFSVMKRTKEVGIRKTLGASAVNIMTLFSKEFVMLVMVSFVVAGPLAYLMMDRWLSNFAYHVEPGVTPFTVSIIISMGIVLATVGFITRRAAIANPVDALKSE